MAKELSSPIINPGKRYQQVSLQHDKNLTPVTKNGELIFFPQIAME